MYASHRNFHFDLKDVIAFRLYLLDHFKEELRHHKHYYIKEESVRQSDLRPLASCQENEMDYVFSRGKELFNFMQIKTIDLQETANSPRDCTALQWMIESLPKPATTQLLASITASLDLFASTKHGAQLVVAIYRCCEDSKDMVIEYCKANFANLAVNEASTRILHALIETENDFRLFAFSFYQKNKSLYLQSFPAVFLLTVCIRHAKDESEFVFLTRNLKNELDLFLESKYFKRVLVSYIEFCSEAEMDRTADLLKISINI